MHLVYELKLVMVKRFKYLVITNNIDDLITEGGSIQGLAYMMQILNGKIEMTYGGHTFCMQCNDLMFSPANRIPTNVICSRDFSCTIYATDSDAISEILYACLRDETNWTKKFQYIWRNPVVHLTQRQVGLIDGYKTLTQYYSESTGEYQCKISDLIGRSIVYELLSWVEEEMRKNRHKKDMKDMEPLTTRINQLYFDFKQLLVHTKGCQRKVQWFANQLKISTQYLNMICNKVANLSPQKILQDVILKECKLLLDNSQYSIKQIAFKLCFPSEASFCRFFRNATALTPSEYRKNPMMLLGKSCHASLFFC